MTREASEEEIIPHTIVTNETTIQDRQCLGNQDHPLEGIGETEETGMKMAPGDA